MVGNVIKMEKIAPFALSLSLALWWWAALHLDVEGDHAVCGFAGAEPRKAVIDAYARCN